MATTPESGLVGAGQHLEQRRLAGAVRSAQSDTIPVTDLPGDAIEERAVSEGLGEFAELNHAAGAPSAWAAASSILTVEADREILEDLFGGQYGVVRGWLGRQSRSSIVANVYYTKDLTRLR